MTHSLALDEVARRLDRLPPGRFHRRFLALVSLGTWFDYYDNFVAGALAVILPEAGVLAKTQAGEWFSAVGLFMAALPLGMFVGTMFLGLASDYLGRRFGFIAMLLLYSLATLAGGAGYYPLVAVAGTSAGLTLLLVTRFLAGAGIGAENVILDAYISEIVPRQIRGRSVAFAHAIAFTAMPVSAVLAWWLAPKSAPEGWPWLLVIGSLGALFTWYFRRRLPESPRWLASVGRADEAVAALERIERTASRGGPPMPPLSSKEDQASESPAPAPSMKRGAFGAIWSPAYRGRTLLLVAFQLLQTIGYYGFMHWLPVLLKETKGFNQDQALLVQALSYILAPVGPLLAVWSSERWQRKWLIVVLTAALASGQILFGLAGGPVVLTLLAALIVLGNNWFSALFHAYQAELFPTEARATGIGFTYAWSRASMMVLSLFMPTLIARSASAALGLMAAAFVGVAWLVGLFGPRTNARALEDVSG
jgi:putative MFS transporter